MQEVMKRAECYIKGEESNAEKRTRDLKERIPENRGKPAPMAPEHNRRPWASPHNGWQNGGRRMQRPFRRREEGRYQRNSYTPLNDTKVHILEEILHTNLATPPPQTNRPMMGPNANEWCKYHRCKGHDTERCYRLEDLIEELIRSEHLRKFIEKAARKE
jgi:hypothetical protein